ncbi:MULTISPECIES: UPF0738 family protein [Solibacillus]|uniref:Uncharacterized protein n=1 Tax=Solibacillus merdavium TaxID=2762218 RepID=A0ABR8XHV6_9BACL|nr:hypothetical protein [Solibacillus merdavium]MBD8031522.1 hypothetical protein [Solibacillus merdavium]
MRNVYIVNQFQAVHNEIHFILNEKKQLSQLQPVGQVIVDSDNEAFLYIIEENDAYSYIGFPQAIWSQLVQMLKSGQQPYLKVEDGLMPLNQFTDELKGLLYNIVGNSNYGNRFVEAVEKEFADFL